MKTLKIEMVHDVVCSWCPIGYSNLKQALRNTQTKAEIRFLPFELNPDMPEKGEQIGAHLMRRNNWDQAQLNHYRQHLLSVAGKAKVEIDFDKRTHYFNTNLAHRLMHLAEKVGKQQEANELLIDAYFKHGMNIGDEETLLELAQRIGLDPLGTRSELKSRRTTEELNAKKRRVNALSIASIPAFLINESLFVSGSNSVEYFENLLADWSVSRPSDAILNHEPQSLNATTN